MESKHTRTSNILFHEQSVCGRGKNGKKSLFKLSSLRSFLDPLLSFNIYSHLQSRICFSNKFYLHSVSKIYHSDFSNCLLLPHKNTKYIYVDIFTIISEGTRFLWNIWICMEENFSTECVGLTTFALLRRVNRYYTLSRSIDPHVNSPIINVGKLCLPCFLLLSSVFILFACFFFFCTLFIVCTT